MTHSELVAELRRVLEGNSVPPRDTDGMSAAELANAMGVHPSTLMRRYLHPLVIAGEVRVGRASRARIDGARVTVPVYTLKEPELG